MNNTEIQTQSKLLKLKGILNDISHVSYSYKELGKNLPYVISDPATAGSLIEAYEQLINDAKQIINNYENYEGEQNAHK